MRGRLARSARAGAGGLAAACRGWLTGRASGALAIGDPGRPVADALDVLRAFAAGPGIRPRVQAPIGSPRDRAVSREGWGLDAGHRAGACGRPWSTSTCTCR